MSYLASRGNRREDHNGVSDRLVALDKRARAARDEGLELVVAFDVDQQPDLSADHVEVVGPEVRVLAVEGRPRSRPTQVAVERGDSRQIAEFTELRAGREQGLQLSGGRSLEGADVVEQEPAAQCSGLSRLVVLFAALILLLGAVQAHGST